MHEIDVSQPHAARVYDYLLGGKANYAVDRALAERFLRDWPELADLARANRAWMIRVVRTLASQGIDRFLDIGSGLPTADNVHQVAQRIAREARVLYVDNDPVVLTHGRSLLAADERAEYVEAPAQDAATILDRADAFLDRDRPVVVLMSAVLHYMPEPPADIVAPYVRWMPPGSHLAISHVALEGHDPELLARIREEYPQQHVRPREEIEAAFAGLEMLEPGLVDAQRWRTGEDAPVGPQPLLAGVARKLATRRAP
ncbi:SAM-dependent methyltransferase [Actinomadura sp. KC216]|uniref:SAM-dependent methyltransferase n=1 Tax=Actinomadura sp. KC216 TaxID=2530370 RepID=UPI00104BFACB|nr:SAM-dependent methyltransferase [Actinomadura sp. KC216]TDB86440.1 SAM-dependent methyltransferase [Actinomadura sp. KC216]